jgi:hypothetical protein
MLDPAIARLLVLCGISWSATAQEVKEKSKWRFSPLPVVYYSPETRLGFGVLLAANFNTAHDSLTSGSYLQTSFIYTLNKQFEWNNQGRIYAPQNKRIFQYRFYYAFFPEYFYGYQTQQPGPYKELIEYNRLWIELRQYWRIKGNIYAGIFGRVNHIYNLNTIPEGTFETAQPTGHDGYTVAGLAPAFHIDSRDSQVYPRKGLYLEVLWAASPALISDFTYGNMRLDARYYKPVNLLKDDVLATQLFVNLNGGTVPFRDMADIGGSCTMRGYYTGYYRYKDLYALQTEYRFMVHKYVGFAVWLGGCAVSDTWSKPFQYSLKPNAGVGLRLRINQKDKLNVRADFGVGKSQTGLYLDAAEAY